MAEDPTCKMRAALALVLPSRRRSSGSYEWMEPSRCVVFAGVGQALAQAALAFMDRLAPRVGGDDAALALTVLDDARAAALVAAQDLVVLVFDAADAKECARAGGWIRARSRRGAWIGIATGPATAEHGAEADDWPDDAPLIDARGPDGDVTARVVAAASCCFFGASFICLSPSDMIDLLAPPGRRVVGTWIGEPGQSPEQACAAARRAAAGMAWAPDEAPPESTLLMCWVPHRWRRGLHRLDALMTAVQSALGDAHPDIEHRLVCAMVDTRLDGVAGFVLVTIRDG